MAKTLRAQRIGHLRSHFERAKTTFDQKVLTLKALFSIRGLGRPTRRWANEKLLWLETDPQFQVNNPIEQGLRMKSLQELHEQNELALKKAETRAENKLKLKEKSKPAAAPTSTPAPAQGGPTSWLDQI